MATTRPDASDTTGTLREVSGVTVPVTANEEVVECALAAASGNCSGWSTAKRLRSTSATTLAGGGASARGSPWALLHPPRSSRAGMKIKGRQIFRPLLFMSSSIHGSEHPTSSPGGGRVAQQRRHHIHG